jgi:hypothetical protein
MSTISLPEKFTTKKHGVKLRGGISRRSFVSRKINDPHRPCLNIRRRTEHQKMFSTSGCSDTRHAASCSLHWFPNSVSSQHLRRALSGTCTPFLSFFPYYNLAFTVAWLW